MLCERFYWISAGAAISENLLQGGSPFGPSEVHYYVRDYTALAERRFLPVTTRSIRPTRVATTS